MARSALQRTVGHPLGLIVLAAAARMEARDKTVQMSGPAGRKWLGRSEQITVVRVVYGGRVQLQYERPHVLAQVDLIQVLGIGGSTCTRGWRIEARLDLGLSKVGKDGMAV